MLAAKASLWNCFEMRQLNCSELGDGVTTFVQLLAVIAGLLQSKVFNFPSQWNLLQELQVIASFGCPIHILVTKFCRDVSRESPEMRTPDRQMEWKCLTSFNRVDGRQGRRSLFQRQRSVKAEEYFYISTQDLGASGNHFISVLQLLCRCGSLGFCKLLSKMNLAALVFKGFFFLLSAKTCGINSKKKGEKTKNAKRNFTAYCL